MIPDISAEEVKKQIKEHRNDKAADQKGIIAEIMKLCGENFIEVMADFFNDILQGRGDVPDQ